jgi:hypothetical protein
MTGAAAPQYKARAAKFNSIDPDEGSLLLYRLGDGDISRATTGLVSDASARRRRREFGAPRRTDAAKFLRSREGGGRRPALPF